MVDEIFRTDWLASKPVFYNEKTLKISYNINDVIDYKNLEFHPEGFNNFLDFGYSVFGQTPIKNVKFLRHSSEIFVENGKLKIIEHPDPVIKWFEKHSNYSDEEEVLNLIKNKINDFENSTTGNIVIPLSGGFDSRLLVYFISDKSRIKAFTYGISENQEDSFEVVYAKKISELLNFSWKRIDLSEQHKYFDLWDELFGISAHAHGMYHIEFYNKILRDKTLEGSNFISGIVADAWAGGINYKKINLDNLTDLGYTHGLNSDSSKSLLKSNFNLGKKFLEIENVKDYRYQTINIIRLKIILLSYLITIPKYFKFNVWTPYLDIDVALSMLNLPPQKRKNRQWQIDFFRKKGIYVEDLNLKFTKKNVLNYKAMEKIPLKPLNKELFKGIIRLDYIDWINKNIKSSKINRIKRIPFQIKYVKGLLLKLKIEESKSKAYYAYLCLKPIENILIKKIKK
jgi:hypothetical protein